MDLDMSQNSTVAPQGATLLEEVTLWLYQYTAASSGAGFVLNFMSFVMAANMESETSTVAVTSYLALIEMIYNAEAVSFYTGLGHYIVNSFDGDWPCKFLWYRIYTESSWNQLAYTWVALDRALALWTPLFYGKYGKKKLGFYILAGITVAIALLHIPIYLTYRRSDAGLFLCEGDRNINQGYTLILQTLIPVCSLVFLSTFVAVGLIKKKNSKNAQRYTRLSVCLICNALIFTFQQVIGNTSWALTVSTIYNDLAGALFQFSYILNPIATFVFYLYLPAMRNGLKKFAWWIK